MLAYAVLLAGFGVLFVAAAGALREGIRHRGRIRGIVVSLAAMLLSLAGLWALLV